MTCTKMIMTDDDCKAATEHGRRAGSSGLFLKACPYAKDDPLARIWRDAWVRATEQRIAHGGASPF